MYNIICLCTHGYILWISILKQWPQSLKVGWCGDDNLKILRNLQSRNIFIHIVHKPLPVKLIDNPKLELPVINTRYTAFDLPLATVFANSQKYRYSFD